MICINMFSPSQIKKKLNSIKSRNYHWNFTIKKMKFVVSEMVFNKN